MRPVSTIAKKCSKLMAIDYLFKFIEEVKNNSTITISLENNFLFHDFNAQFGYSWPIITKKNQSSLTSTCE